jgi:plastocyanin
MESAKTLLHARTLLAIGMLGVTIALGCSDDDPPTASVKPVDGSGGINVVVEGTSFSAERIEVQAGATTTITLDNRDPLAHTLTVYLGGAPEGDIAADTGQVEAGESGEAVVFFASAGEHAFRCEVHPDRMRGTLVVR